MRKILSYVRPYAFYMSVGMFIKFVGALMDLALPYLLAYLGQPDGLQGGPGHHPIHPPRPV